MKTEIIEKIARAMIEYDKNNVEKTWKGLATVAYTTCIESLLFDMEKTNGRN
jgi:hypothetical protein